MRIISKFRDYYDGVQAHGQDDRVVYERFTEEIDFRPWEDELLGEIIELSGIKPPFSYDHVDMIIKDYYIIGICGKLHTVIKTRLSFRANRHERMANTIHTVDEYEDMLNSIPEGKVKKSYLETYNDNGKRMRSIWTRKYRNDDWHSSIQNFFGFDEYEDMTLFNKFNTPLFLVKLTKLEPYQIEKNKDACKIIINPSLHEYQIQRKLDPYTIFQEIEMFLGGVLGMSGPKMAEVKDADRIAKHGYDKWSFRKLPGKKKK